MSDVFLPPPLHEEDKLIVAAVLCARSQQVFDELREAFFPPRPYTLAAHLTLFHALPAHAVASLWPHVQQQAKAIAPMPFAAPGPYGLGRGVAIGIDCAPLATWRRQTRAWLLDQAVLLSAQDRHDGRLHVTVQNKVSPSDAHRTLQSLSMGWGAPLHGVVHGVALYRYDHGPWHWLHTASFAAAPQADKKTRTDG